MEQLLDRIAKAPSGTKFGGLAAIVVIQPWIVLRVIRGRTPSPLAEPAS